MRRERAEGLHVTRIDLAKFRVHNPENNNEYVVDFGKRPVQCECEDYKKQREVLQAGACKHIYACLLKMNYTTLREYLDAPREIEGG